MRKKPPKLAGRPVKDSDPDVEDWMTDMRDHIVNIPTDDDELRLYWTISPKMLKRKPEIVNPTWKSLSQRMTY